VEHKTECASLVGSGSFFEDFTVGDRMRHSRGATIDEVEGNYLSKLVMNTAEGHWNEDVMQASTFGSGRLVFGLITGSLVVGLASQDTAENAVAELGLDDVRFVRPVHHGDTVYAYTEVVGTYPGERPEAGVVEFKHWGVNQHGEVVCELCRTVSIRRRETECMTEPATETIP
jgi:itaconyl-CoA hydratase